MDDRSLHWHRPPSHASIEFIENAPVDPTDSRTRSGKPLRDLLRAGVIQGGDQRPDRPWGRWYITRILTSLGLAGGIDAVIAAR